MALIDDGEGDFAAFSRSDVSKCGMLRIPVFRFT